MSWGELLLYNESVRILVLATLLGVIAASQSLFDYDRTLPFDFQSEPLSTRKDVRVSGASIQIIKAHRMDFVLVEPVERTGTARSPLVIYQHGGGQSMSNYVAEAALLSKAGVVSMIIEAPFRREPKADPNSMPTGAALRDDSANVVIAIRRSLDWLETRPNVDRQRVAYVGHSYGGNAGALLTALDKRFKTFVLMGLVAKYSQHIAGNQSDVWVRLRSALKPEELAEVVELLRQVDPDQFLPKSNGAPLLFQCARFDMDDVKADCEVAFNKAAGPKTLRWYDVEHPFADLDATLDRLRWIAAKLNVPAVHKVLAAEAGRTWKGD